LYDVGVMDDSIEHSSGQSGVAAERTIPLLERRSRVSIIERRLSIVDDLAEIACLAAGERQLSDSVDEISNQDY
jgi:hypothetical protein